jgi:hypothetical protein
MGSIPASARSDQPAWSPIPLHDSCGRQCQHVTLPDLFDNAAAAALYIVPGRCVVLDALPHVQWTAGGLRTLSWRCAGRIPLVFDQLPEPMASGLAEQIAFVLDWVKAGAA